MININSIHILITVISVFGLLGIIVVLRGLKEIITDNKSLNKNKNNENKKRRNEFNLRTGIFFSCIVLISIVMVIISVSLHMMGSFNGNLFFPLLFAFLVSCIGAWFLSSVLMININNTLRQMNMGLDEAALAASELSIAKELQKKFIPLDFDSEGRKLNYSSGKTGHLDVFAYYEGARGMSGDYFDYRDLDGRYIALIKCDVSGKGIPAALIMIQVATMFKNHFMEWKPDTKGMAINLLVMQINSLIEPLAFGNRFAALTICILDSHTGILRLCSAGDRVIHIFDASMNGFRNIVLSESPAAGILPAPMIEESGGYRVNTLNLKPNDILLLYTDGIEESKRKFRNEKFRITICRDSIKDTEHGNHLAGQADEEMGQEWVEGIINAVMKKEIFTLHKWHNPEGEENNLEFDFTNCKGEVEDVIMALVSVEKMFRSYKMPDTEDESRVQVDRKIDAFLRKHFRQYNHYCSKTAETDNKLFLEYLHLNEDEMHDDLTILGIKIK